ncbi:MAG: hypothetical protein DI560_25450 [Pseudomonas putida]|nr:MAG: hypothetical protein DI560_25450 [Pseudomonas putida]
MGAASAAKQATRWMAPALPVFAAEAAPTRTADLYGFEGGGHSEIVAACAVFRRIAIIGWRGVKRREWDFTPPEMRPASPFDKDFLIFF